MDDYTNEMINDYKNFNDKYRVIAVNPFHSEQGSSLLIVDRLESYSDKPFKVYLNDGEFKDMNQYNRAIEFYINYERTQILFYFFKKSLGTLLRNIVSGTSVLPATLLLIYSLLIHS